MTMPLPTPHLEARSDYEALETASARVGYNLYDVEKLAWKCTPMLRGVNRFATVADLVGTLGKTS